MKKIFLFGLLLSATITLNAQIKLPASTKDVAGSFVSPPAIGDVGKTSNAIADELTSKLGLNAAQKSGTLDAVKGFLGEKQSILGLAKSDQAGYLSKFNGLQSGLFGKFKTIMGAAKFANFLKLKPTGNGAGNILSNLFF